MERFLSADFDNVFGALPDPAKINSPLCIRRAALEVVGRNKTAWARDVLPEMGK